jgi:hypothetical protein
MLWFGSWKLQRIEKAEARSRHPNPPSTPTFQ